MQVVNVRELKTNPSVALRAAKLDLMMITNRNKPDALLISMEQLTGLISEMGIPVVDYSPEDAESEADFTEKWVQEHKA